METLYVFIVIAVLVIIVIARTATVVPQQSAYVVENLGRYSRTLQAGFHILIPFVERIAYKHTLKEDAVDIPEQVCITRDNVQVGVDGVLYLQVLDAQRGAIVLADPLTGKLKLRALATGRGEANPGRFHFSHNLANRCFDSGESLLCCSVAEDPNLANAQSIAATQASVA